MPYHFEFTRSQFEWLTQAFISKKSAISGSESILEHLESGSQLNIQAVGAACLLKYFAGKL